MLDAICCTLFVQEVFFFKQKTAYEMRISDWSSDVCSSDLLFDPALLARYRDTVAAHARFSRGTTHISVVDDAGNLAALSLSNGEGYGTLLPDSGIMLNNMLGEEDLNHGGFHCWPEDSRLSSMMAPTLATSAEGARFAIGSGGSNRIRTAVLQVLVNLLDVGLPMAAATEAARLHIEGEADRKSTRLN